MIAISSIIYQYMTAEGELSNPAWYIVSAIILALVPIAVGLLTSYVKISIVLGIIKNALGTQHAPGAMVTLALSLALTGITMNPVIKETLSAAKSIDLEIISKSPSLEMLTALTPLADPWINFLRKNSGTRELAVLNAAMQNSSSELHQVATITPGTENPSTAIDTKDDEHDFSLLIPAFLLSELKEGFSMAFIVLLPFLAIDLIVSNILMGLGMMMVSPVLISLPIKLILFVVSDAWLLITQGIIRSYQL